MTLTEIKKRKEILHEQIKQFRWDKDHCDSDTCKNYLDARINRIEKRLSDLGVQEKKK